MPVRESLENLALLLPRLLQGLITRDFARAGKRLVGWSPRINSVNDHTGFYLQRRCFDLYGFWGHCFQLQGGATCGAQYAFLPLVILWKLGVCGFLLFSISAYVALFVLVHEMGALCMSSWLWVLVGTAALCSPYFKNATFAAGRYDIPGWALLVGGLVLLLEHQLSWAVVILTFAFMSHPSVTLVGAVYLGIFVAIGRIGGEGLLCFVCAQGLNVFWTIPFVRVKKLKILAAHSWAVPLVDRTRTKAVYLPKLAGMVFFAVSYLSVSHEPRGLVFCLVPLAAFVWNCWKDKFVNRFSVELLWLASGAAAVAYANAPFLYIPYLVSLFAYAAPSPRFGFPFRPHLVQEQKLLAGVRDLYKTMGDNVRMGFVTCPENADQWRLDAKHKFIFNLALLDDQQWVESFEVGPNSRAQTGHANSSTKERWDQDLKNRVVGLGLDYVVSTAHYKCRLDRVKWLSKKKEVSVPELGSVPATAYVLYKVDLLVSRASRGCKIVPLPTGELEIMHPGARVGIKYNAVPGLRAVQEDSELPIYADESGWIVLHCENDRPVRILRDPRRLWLPGRRIPERRTPVMSPIEPARKGALGE